MTSDEVAEKVKIDWTNMQNIIMSVQLGGR